MVSSADGSSIVGWRSVAQRSRAWPPPNSKTMGRSSLLLEDHTLSRGSCRSLEYIWFGWAIIQSKRSQSNQCDRWKWDFTVYVYIYISQWEPSFRSSGSRCCMCVNRGISRFNDGRSNHFQNVTSRKALDDSVVLINCIYCTENCGATPCLRQIFEYLKILFSSASKFWFDR